MSLVFIDPTNNQDYTVEATTTLNKKINGDGLLEVRLFETKENADFINKVGKLWWVSNVEGNGDKRKYVIISINKKTVNKKPTISIVAREKVYDDLANDRIYEKIDGSYTGKAYFDAVFKDTIYNYTLVATVYAQEWQNAGEGDSRLNLFLGGIDRYGLEFEYLPQSNTFMLKDKVSREPAYYLSRRINAKEISVDEDASNWATYARGYGNFSDEEGFEKALLIREYVHPLEKVFKQRRHAEPIKDGRIKIEETMDKALKSLVDDSLKISISVDFLTTKLRDKTGKMNYVSPKEGDIIMVEDDTINFRERFRILEIKETRDARHVVTKQVVTLGDKSREERYYQSISEAQKYLDDLKRGRVKLGYSVLPQAVKTNTDALKRARTNLEFGLSGITARDPLDPNVMTVFNSRGIGISDNGGYNFKSAITGYGINADAITTGTLIADHIRGGTLASNNDDVLFELDAGKLSFQKNSSIDFYSSKNSIKYNYDLEKYNEYTNKTETIHTSIGMRILDNKRDQRPDSREVGLSFGVLDYDSDEQNTAAMAGGIEFIKGYLIKENNAMTFYDIVNLYSDTIKLGGSNIKFGVNGMEYYYSVDNNDIVDPTLYKKGTSGHVLAPTSPPTMPMNLGTTKKRFDTCYTNSFNGIYTYQNTDQYFSAIQTFGSGKKRNFATEHPEYSFYDGVGIAFSEQKNDAYIKVEDSYYSFREIVKKMQLKEYRFYPAGRGMVKV